MPLLWNNDGKDRLKGQICPLAKKEVFNTDKTNLKMKIPPAICRRPSVRRGTLLRCQAVRLQYTRFAWAGGTFFPVVLLCQFLFWWEIGFGFTHYYVLRVSYSCGVVLVFLVLAGNSFWCYVHT